LHCSARLTNIHNAQEVHMKIRSMLLMVIAISLASALGAQEYKVVIPQVSPAAIETYTNLTKAMLDAAGVKYTIEVVPFARAVFMIEDKQADMLISEVENPDQAKTAALKVDTSTTPLFQVAFVLYTNKTKPLNIDELKNGNPKKWVVETDIAHLDYFPGATVGSSAIDASLQKVNAGRIDGYVFAQGACDAVIKKLDLKNITRTFYGLYTAKVMIQKGTKGGTIDKALTLGFNKIKANGTYDKIMSQYLSTVDRYLEWQP